MKTRIRLGKKEIESALRELIQQKTGQDIGDVEIEVPVRNSANGVVYTITPIVSEMYFEFDYEFNLTIKP